MTGPDVRRASGRGRWRRLIGSAAAWAAFIGAAFVWPPFAAAQEAGRPDSAPAATVGDEPIYAAEIDELLADAPSARGAEGEALKRFKAEALEQLINRRLAYRSLVKLGFHPTDDEVDELLDDLKARLAAQQLEFATFLDRHTLTEPLVRRRLAWDFAWTRYQEQTLTDEALEKYFDAHRRDFDGTQLRVSHILLKVEPPADRAAKIAEAEKLRKEIISGKLSFAAAAEKYSAGPSRRQGGDLGFIPRHDQMAEAFSAAAFRLQKGAISPPVVTPFGVHLIACTDVKPGRETWQSRRRALAESLSRERFLKLADDARPQAAVEYTGASPYFKPGTRELVAPEGATK